METAFIQAKLEDIFRDVFDDDHLVISPGLTADDVDEWDSLSHIRLMLTVEKVFGVKFSASEVGKLKNVGDLATMLASKLP